MIAFLGRNSKVLNDTDEGVHIIMDKVTSKTMDAYVEFVSLEDAMRAVERHRTNVVAGRFSRLGDRPIEVEVTSQASLMKDLFPIARGVFWNGVTPEILPFKPNQPWDNFKGFISEEEMIMLVKHVEVPHRVRGHSFVLPPTIPFLSFLFFPHPFLPVLSWKALILDFCEKRTKK